MLGKFHVRRGHVLLVKYLILLKLMLETLQQNCITSSGLLYIMPKKSEKSTISLDKIGDGSSPSFESRARAGPELRPF